MNKLLSPLKLLYHKIMAIFANIRYRFPARKLKVIGVTGTNGKTTTVNLIADIFHEAGIPFGMASTINFRIKDEKWTNVTKMTTQSAGFIQKFLRQLVNEGCTHAIIEVSSHALHQSRVLGVNFGSAAITNVTVDHLEYHGGFEKYRKAKELLFRSLSSYKGKTGKPSASILNIDDKENFEFFNQYNADRKYTYGIESGLCRAKNVVLHDEGSKWIFSTPFGDIDINLNLIGEVNVYNALAAACIALAEHIPLETIKSALEKCSTVPGRFENLKFGQPYKIIVDYGHTSDALEKLFSIYRRLTKGDLIVVFGATGGGRDKGKRSIMGEIADKYADYIILTDDDPYEEDEIEIIEMIAKGIKRKEGEKFWKIPDRYEAIKLGLSLAKKDDTVIVSGKGCEEIMMIHGKKIPWNDVEVIKGILSREIKVEI
ncbi:MAG: UDP-N-acetylmuramoyl-L-alanyl-D-glutamate--2,6-diaminopimelate ligase [Candidatus Gracilibacteria bacterium]